uniref:ABM domain-containing protein n=1 Tax=Tetraselmis chuii TaxID=63592 RepID=A0A7S1T0L0_9CHLO|mmetsp:Transcript_39176/g.70164  ORF Transcript_39176/g.70164 Transcript_39176/m.70164 type:complete len:102 (+) Transcript_39176:150-455(+)
MGSTGDKLTVVARLRVNPAHIDTVRPELLKLVEATRKEEACIKYELHEDNTVPGRFVFFENWTTRELWTEHMNSDHIKAFGVATAGKVDEFELFEMSQIEP